jgi:hypothetical protein
MKNGKLGSDFLEHFTRFMRDTRKTKFILVFQAAQYHNLISDHYGMVDYFRGRISEGPIEIRPFTRNEVYSLINDPVKENYFVLDEGFDLIEALTGGSPFLCAKLGRVLWDNRSDLDSVNHNHLMKIWSYSLVDDKDWGSFLDRMIQKIPDKLIDLLRFIALKEINKSTDLWQEFGNHWISEAQIYGHMRTTSDLSKNKCINLLQSLEQSTLLKSKVNGNKSSWRLSSDLLAYRLAKGNFNSDVIRH